MNMTLSTINQWKEVWNGLTHTFADKEIIIAPSHPHIHLVKDIPVSIASQDVSDREKGAHTGETGAFQLKEFVKYSIVGHSERGERRDTVLRKATLCLENQITPIVCFTALEDAKVYSADGVILAWEDPDNISKDGVYRPKPIEQIETEVKNMRQNLPSDVKMVYGGSVNKDNITGLKRIGLLDGVLVGNASLDPEHFHGLITA